MRLNDIYRSDERYDTSKAAQHIIDWYDEVYDIGGERKSKIDELFSALDLSGEDADELFRRLLTVHPQQLNKLYRNIKAIMGRR